MSSQNCPLCCRQVSYYEEYLVKKLTNVNFCYQISGLAWCKNGFEVNMQAQVNETRKIRERIELFEWEKKPLVKEDAFL